MSRRRTAAFGLGIAALLLSVAALGELLPATTAVRAESGVARLASLKVDYRLLPADFDRLAPTADDFGVTSTGEVYLAGLEGLAQAPRRPGGQPSVRPEHDIESLAVGADDALLLAGDGGLRAFDPAGGATETAPLPAGHSRLVPSARRGEVYVLNQSPTRTILARVSQTGEVRVLVRSDAPLVAAADTESELFVASANQVLRVGTDRLDVVFEAPADPEFGPILSLAAAPDGLVFISTAKRVYAVLDREALSIVNDSGGALRWRDGRLYVLDPGRRLLYALRPATRDMFPDS